MRLEGSVEIERPLGEVFDFVADPRNDPSWCERVTWCRQVAGDGPGPGARYEALHRPSGYPWSHIRRIDVVEFEPPRSVRWTQVDRIGIFDIRYELEATERGTRLSQHDDVDWSLPMMSLIGRRIVYTHIGDQHQALRAVLER